MTNTMTDTDGNTIQIANAKPAPTAADMARAADLLERAAAAELELPSVSDADCQWQLGSTIQAWRAEAADLADRGTARLLVGLRHIATGALYSAPVATRYGHAYATAGGWVDLAASPKAAARKGCEWVGIWV